MKKSQAISASRRRKGVVGTLSAFLLLLSVLTASPAQAASGDVVVGEGESIQAAIDAADPGTRIVIEGAHTENLWISTDNISLVGKNSDASITMPEVAAPNGCAPPEFSPVICFFPDTAEDPPLPGDYLNGGLVAGLTINGGGDSVAMIFTNRAYVRRNTMNGQACDAVFIIFSTSFDVDNNTMSNSPFCDGINVSASRRGRISNNTSTDNMFSGITVQDSQHVTIRDNEVTGNCIGITVFDGSDGGYPGPEGSVFDEDQPSNNITIKRNNASNNSNICFPFGPDLPLGGTGILVGGQKITVKDNVTNDNAIGGFSITAGGIIVPLSLDPSLPAVEKVVLAGNTAFSNTSADGPADIVIQIDPSAVRTRANKCGVSTPDASICGVDS